MGILTDPTHDPIAQALGGLCGESVDNPDINGVALTTFGFLYATGAWFDCAALPSTSWSTCVGVSTGWTFCGPFD